MKKIPNFRWLYPALAVVLLFIIGIFPHGDYRPWAMIGWIVVIVEYLSFTFGGRNEDN